MLFKFSSVLSTVDLWKHLIMAWNIRKFMRLVNFVNFTVFYFFFGNRVWLNLYKRGFTRAGTFGKWDFYNLIQVASICENVRARVYSM